ncbi:MAG: acyl-CoA dehydrogenase [Chloroflexi bacterium AL-W]|nr:acyl-CoA dehydrogenase [Chloroflexi bacterium AL-N1]NOK65916.1 acyl-CoA dehydrogenase [Chloroflexi bacterium AL-N10]NOK72797.1 acyl-CoA dehydrogenase [Chloroflexi bacterium AL-N5]NOK79694.1 acyl-CoA dehydrogenase [Chloroflexi bacterium AL-W]NOK93019.1 acyl-CoA dehydrogenase [Chloroflexi bacterium AL-N15]
MIDFELPEPVKRQVEFITMMGQQVMRPVARYYDEHESERPWDYINMMWPTIMAQGGRSFSVEDDGGKKNGKPRIGHLMLIHVVEALSWGDAGLYLSTPGGALGGAAVDATGTPEQKERFLKRFREGEPKWAAMAMTESHAGSDTAAIRTSARLTEDGKHWVINGEKIFVTGGLMAAKESPGFVVVWATIDPAAGRGGMKPFVVEAGTPGMTVAKVEHKHGIRASDTASLVFQDCRIPFDNVLGSPEITKHDGSAESRKGFRGAMKTFDATRPAVAASALGIARASLEFVVSYLKEHDVQIRHGVPTNQQTAIERELLEMEAQHRAAWLLVLKAAVKMDARQENTLEASMAKVKAGAVANFVTQKAVELLGPEGYSCKLLLEKWMRDARINDIYEGTGQINRLIVARRILGYSSKELR